MIKSKKSLVENKIKDDIEQLLSKYKHGKQFMDKENSRVNEPHKFVPNLWQRLDLRFSNKMLPFKTYLFITCKKNIRKQ